MQMVHGVGAVRPRRQSPSADFSRSPSPTLRRSLSPSGDDGHGLPQSSISSIARPGAALVATPARTSSGNVTSCNWIPGGRSVCEGRGRGADELVVKKSGLFEAGGCGLDFLPRPGLNSDYRPGDPNHWSNHAHGQMRPMFYSEGDVSAGLVPPDGARDRDMSPFGSPRLPSPGRTNRGRGGGKGSDTPRFGSPVGYRGGEHYHPSFDLTDFDEAAAAASRRRGRSGNPAAQNGASGGRTQQRVEVRDSVDEAEECPVTCCGLDGGGRKAGAARPDGDAPRPLGYGEGGGGRIDGSCWTRRG